MLLAVLGAVVAGALTTLAPCSLSLLPVIVGGSVQGAAPGRSGDLRRAIVVTGALGVSVFAFTLLLKASTALIGISPSLWQAISGGILIALGVVALVPELWDRISVATGLERRTAQGLDSAARRTGSAGALLTGLALGPVFTSCSPLYAYVVVTVLPSAPTRGLVLLIGYVIGLTGLLLAIALLGQRLVRRLRWAADPHSVLRRVLGALFVVVGVLILTGLMQDLEAWLLVHSPVQPWDLWSDAAAS